MTLQGCQTVVLGGLGFIGSHLTDALLDRGAKVRVFDRVSVKPVLDCAQTRIGLEVVEGDFTSSADLDAVLSGVDICFHLVSTTLPQSSNLDPVYDAQTNLVGSLRLIDAAVRHRVKRIVFISSGGTIYGRPQTVPISETHPTDPMCAYGITKLAIEKHLELARHIRGLDYAVLRLANPYGPRQRPEANQGAVAVFAARALRGQTIEVWGDGSIVRDFVHIDDVVSALLKAAVPMPSEERIFNIGSGTGVSVAGLLGTIGCVLGRDLPIAYRPARGFDVPVNVLDIARACKDLRWAPTVTLEDGIRGYMAWLSAATPANVEPTGRANGR